MTTSKLLGRGGGGVYTLRTLAPFLFCGGQALNSKPCMLIIVTKVEVLIVRVTITVTIRITVDCLGYFGSPDSRHTHMGRVFFLPE